MGSQQLWIKVADAIEGPLSASQLRALARAGRVTLTTPVSLDKNRWVLARNVKGLFDAPTTAGQNSSPPAVASGRELPPIQSEQRAPVADVVPANPFGASPSNPGDPGTWMYPIIRTYQLAFGEQVVAVYPSHLLVGTRYFSALRIREEMCHVDGEQMLQNALHKRRRLEVSDLGSAKEKVCANHSRFRLKFNNSRPVQFRIEDSQVGRIRQFLHVKLQDKYLIRRQGERGFLIAALFFSLLLWFAFYAYIHLASLFGGVVFALILAALQVFLIAGIVRRTKWATSEKFLADEAAKQASSGKKTKVQPDETSAVRQPFRSRTLGTILKIAGVIWWIVVLSPLTDGIQKAFGQNAVSSQYAWVLLTLPAGALLYSGYLLCQRGYEPKSGADTRKPILFLRPFTEDAAVTLQPPGLLASLTGIRTKRFVKKSNAATKNSSPIWDCSSALYPMRVLRILFNHDVGTSEESLARFFETYGPVIAVGRPGEKLATAGAARMYLSDDEWQAAVREELKRSQSVVLQPGLSTGVHWELEQVRRHVEPFRILICLVAYWHNPEAYEELEVVCESKMGLKFPRVVPHLQQPAFLYFDREWKPHLQEMGYRCPTLWPLSSDAADLRYCLQPFVEGMHGGQRETPRPARWSGGSSTALAGAIGAILALSISIAWVQGIRLATAGLFPSQKVATANSSSTAHSTISNARITVHGVYVPCVFEIPENLVSFDPPKAVELPAEVIQRWWKSSDFGLVLQVVETKEQQDLSNFDQQTLAAIQSKFGETPNVTSKSEVRAGNLDWTEVRWQSVRKDGVRVNTIMRGATTPQGTIYVYLLLSGSSVYTPVAEQVLNSFRLPE